MSILSCKRHGAETRIDLRQDQGVSVVVRPQAGRYREFTQVGIEILGPDTSKEEAISVLRKCLDEFGLTYKFVPAVQRGLTYYVEDGFEARLASFITAPPAEPRASKKPEPSASNGPHEGRKRSRAKAIDKAAKGRNKAILRLMGRNRRRRNCCAARV